MAGFKSFAEPTAIDIEPGLTGIVGPNGCGKSNIVEGLRWVMGESSARQMRGNEMDDVIFAGTEQRPSRNLAEITLQLDNSQRSAPAEFNDIDDIEVKRKIERGKGSSYTVNAKPARARDIQLLFADTATGARTSGIVSQGRIGAIVGAKPVDRRVLIEEAANIRGLHARRHEAELRLRGAETNLERLDDVIASLIEQREALKNRRVRPPGIARWLIGFAKPRHSFCLPDGRPPKQTKQVPMKHFIVPSLALPNAPRLPPAAPQPAAKLPQHCRHYGPQRLKKRLNISALLSAGKSLTVKRPD